MQPLRAGPRDWFAGRSRRQRLAFLTALFAFFLSVYIITASGDVVHNGDTIIRFTVTQDLVEKHTPSLIQWHVAKPTKKNPYRDPRTLYGKHHKVYAIYTAGQSLAGIPLYLLGKAVAIHLNVPAYPSELFSYRLVDPIFGALLAILIFLFCVRLGYSAPLAVGMSLLFGFATSAWPDEQSGLELTQESFFVFLGVYLAFRFVSIHERWIARAAPAPGSVEGNGAASAVHVKRPSRASWLLLVLAGLSVGMGMVTRYTAAIAIPPIALYLMLPVTRASLRQTGWWLRAIARNALFGVGVLPLLAFDLWYNEIRFGSYTATGHTEKIFGHPILEGIGGLLISPGKGLIWYTPLLFLLLIGVPRFARRRPSLAILFLAMTLSYVVFYGAVQYWHGDPAWGPRYIYPVLPYVTLPIVEVFRIRGRWVRAGALLAAGIVIAISFVVQFVAVTVSMWRGYYILVQKTLAHHKRWFWDASQYHYFWNVQLSPLLNQFASFRKVFLIETGHTRCCTLVPPEHAPQLSALVQNYPVNSWALWWTYPNFNWWIGQHRIDAILVGLVAVALAGLLYVILDIVPGARRPLLADQPRQGTQAAA